MKPAQKLACSLCARPQAEVSRLIAGAAGSICERCLDASFERLRQERLASIRSAPPVRPVAVIPARHSSSRFPGKPLALIAGKSMVWHVHRRCAESQAFSRIMVATDDPRIADEVHGFGGEAVLTSADCASGTDRVAEVARNTPSVGPQALRGAAPTDVFINVQGDEPAIHPSSLSTLSAAFDDPSIEMATLIRPLSQAERENPNVVKALVGADGNALYFSRADLPYPRNPSPGLSRWGHLGIYGYRRATLERLSSLPPSPLEQSESLEQLRALENGIRIACRRTDHRSIGVDRPEDLPLATALLRELGLA